VVHSHLLCIWIEENNPICFMTVRLVLVTWFIHENWGIHHRKLICLPVEIVYKYWTSSHWIVKLIRPIKTLFHEAKPSEIITNNLEKAVTPPGCSVGIIVWEIFCSSIWMKFCSLISCGWHWRDDSLLFELFQYILLIGSELCSEESHFCFDLSWSMKCLGVSKYKMMWTNVSNVLLVNTNYNTFSFLYTCFQLSLSFFLSFYTGCHRKKVIQNQLVNVYDQVMNFYHGCVIKVLAMHFLSWIKSRTVLRWSVKIVGTTE
jgi:hypothetical protein